jgi:hypothetical protein
MELQYDWLCFDIKDKNVTYIKSRIKLFIILVVFNFPHEQENLWL